jgi:aryl-alcohol dehydrogenase-like predicted oxidoreductase
MRKRRLGSSDLMVSEISLGSWAHHGGGVERERAEACVAKAFEVGIDFIDTANVYARGRAEEFLGEVLADRPRDSYVLATKLFWPMPDGGSGLSRDQIFTQLEASLRRLRTEYVDLYQCHPLRLAHTAGGDDAGPDRGRPPGQGALPRLQ